MENQEIMYDVNEEIANANEQEVVEEGGNGVGVGMAVLLGLALYGGVKAGQKVIAIGKDGVAFVKKKLSDRKAKGENVEADETESEKKAE